MSKIEIREEQAVDIAAIDQVNVLAFGRRAEADLVAELRQNQKITLSLVAVLEDHIVGHILFSPMRLITEMGASRAAAGLGPLAVLPEYQRRGIGSALIEHGLARSRQAGQAVLFVLGDPAYYSRFGFQQSTAFGIRCAYDVPEDAFMALELKPGALAGVSGVAHYEPEFDGV